MDYTQFNGKTVGQNLDGMATFFANAYILIKLLPVILIMVLYASPFASMVWFGINLSWTSDPRRMEVVNEFRSEVAPNYRQMGKIDYTMKVQELEDKMAAQYKSIDDPRSEEEKARQEEADAELEEASEYDLAAYASVFWKQCGSFFVNILIGVVILVPYAIVSLHIWRTILRYVHVAYLFLNCLWFYNWNILSNKAHTASTIFAFFVPITQDYMFWNIVNMVGFVGIFIMYFIFLFGKPIPESRKERRRKIREAGYRPTLADYLI